MSYVDFSTLTDAALPHDHARLLARMIQQQWPDLRLIRLPADHPEFTPEKPYAIRDLNPLTFNEIVEVYPESMLDNRLYAMLLENDTRGRNGMTRDKFWAIKKANQDAIMKKREEEQAQRMDILYAASRHFANGGFDFRYHDGDSGDTIVLRR